MFNRKKKLKSEIEKNISEYLAQYVQKSPPAPNYDADRLGRISQQANALQLEFARALQEGVISEEAVFGLSSALLVLGLDGEVRVYDDLICTPELYERIVRRHGEPLGLTAEALAQMDAKEMADMNLVTFCDKCGDLNYLTPTFQKIETFKNEPRCKCPGHDSSWWVVDY